MLREHVEAGVDHVDVLRRARLPDDLLNHDDVRLDGRSIISQGAVPAVETEPSRAQIVADLILEG